MNCTVKNLLNMPVKALFLLIPILSFFSCANNKFISIRDKQKNTNTNLKTEELNVKKDLVKNSVNKNVDELTQNFINNWLETPYKYGGVDKNGIDCSGLTGNYFLDVYNIKINRTAAEQFKQGESINRAFLKKGDLVFFAENKDGNITHVGIYLYEGYFLHASTSRGVVISTLNDSYYRERYVSAKRLN